MRKLSNFLGKLVKASQSGFTLIELLVVIGILGILVTALVATINPFEQIKKGDDAVLKNVAAEFQTATLRYYTTHGALPWDNDGTNNGGGDPDCFLEANSDGMFEDPVQLNTLTACIESLTDDKELKEGFTDFKGLTDLWVTENDFDTSVCFKPKSISQRKAPETKYDQDGTFPNPNATCPDLEGDPIECYFCVK